MDSAALDRALCERLGIEPRLMMWQVGDEPGVHVFSHWDATLVQQWHERHREYCDRLGYQVREAPIYPALSTTGDGMVLLMEALRRKTGRLPRVGAESNGSYRAIVVPNAPTFTERFNALSSGAADTAPMALAMAAAAALGIEVQP